MEKPLVANMSVANVTDLVGSNIAMDMVVHIPGPDHLSPALKANKLGSSSRIKNGTAGRLLSSQNRPQGPAVNPDGSSMPTVGEEESPFVTMLKSNGSFRELSTRIDRFLKPGGNGSSLAKGLVVHFHGGGFVSQSSNSHAVYLREWAAYIPDSVIISIDYKLAPEHQYPIALNECLHSYLWAIHNSHQLGTRAERVVLAGDSAGGNFALSVSLKAAALSARRPDGVVLAYPALLVTLAWSPSRILSFFDPLLNAAVLHLCLRSYVPEGADANADPFISPMVAGEEMLRGLPPVSVVTGSLDPLLDDSVMFAHRMRAAGR